MAVFEQGAIVRVPFPYTDRGTRQHRPALIVNSNPVGENDALVWVIMITSAENRSWPGDVAISRFQKSGLPAPSVVRTAKIATIEARHADRIGAIEKQTLDAVMRQIRTTISGAT